MNTRREFSPTVKRAALKRSRGVCECHRIPRVFEVACGRPLGEGNCFYEHVTADGAGGDPTLDNCAALTKTCWTYKTNQYDKKQVADTKRLADRSRNIRPRVSRPLPGGRHSAVKISIWRGPVNRRTGEPWSPKS